MARNISDIVQGLPRARRQKIESAARRLAEEMLREADSLEQLRKAVGKTQVEVAEVLGVKQNAISQLENRTDLYVSTLSKYVGALGHRLELALVTPDGQRVLLPNLHPWTASAAPAKRGVRAQPARRSAKAVAVSKRRTPSKGT